MPERNIATKPAAGLMMWHFKIAATQTLWPVCTHAHTSLLAYVTVSLRARRLTAPRVAGNKKQKGFTHPCSTRMSVWKTVYSNEKWLLWYNQCSLTHNLFYNFIVYSLWRHVSIIMRSSSGHLIQSRIFSAIDTGLFTLKYIKLHIC